MSGHRLNRRRFLLNAGLAAAGLFLHGGFLRSCAGAASKLLYVGTYTSGDSVGIYRCRFRYDTEELDLVGETPGITNPSYLAIAENGEYLYSVIQVADYRGRETGGVAAFEIARGSGELTLLNQQASEGAGPCYITTDKEDKLLLVANYTSGTVAALPITSEGRLEEAADMVQHTGSSVNERRQQGPHAHCIIFDPANRYVFATDLGIDKILIYALDRTRGTLVPNDQPFVKTSPGAGPRHITFHPGGKWLFAINELNSTITRYGYNEPGGILKAEQTVSTLPPDFRDSNTCADIHISPDGSFLYGSNRGHDSIVIYAVDPSTGELSYVEHESTRGNTPRNFVIDPTGYYLLAANQNSDSITIFRRDNTSGALTFTGKNLAIPSPVCLKFL